MATRFPGENKIRERRMSLEGKREEERGGSWAGLCLRRLVEQRSSSPGAVRGENRNPLLSTPTKMTSHMEKMIIPRKVCRVGLGFRW
ncbi:hypothetical protein ZWY2020_011111 [Hordeum vulgare]|nr:hypothetical protein ZWY2020_011111 [Hordeum vulgare]